MKPYICSQCGAPLHGEICEYCGTSFDEPSMGELITLYSDDLVIQHARYFCDSAMSAILTPNELRQYLSCYGVTMNEAATALCDVGAAIRQYGETDEIMMSVPIGSIKPKYSIWQKIKSLFKGKEKRND